MLSTQPRALRPERALLHPLWLAALVLLLANDRFLKGSGIVHHLLTGKLSDFAGMLVAPALLAALVRVASRRGLFAAHVAVGVVFAAIKLSPPCAALLESAMGLLGLRWHIWVDPTDLVALPFLFVSYRVLSPAMEQAVAPSARLRQAGQLAAATVGLVACLGTSQAPPEAPPQPPPPAEPAVQMAEPPPAALDLSALSGSRWRSGSADREGGSYLVYHFDGARYTTAGYPPSEESGRVEVIEAHGRTMRVRFVDRMFEGDAEEPMTRTIDVAVDGQSFVMDGRTFVRDGANATVATEE
jgi:hypothetical protein